MASGSTFRWIAVLSACLLAGEVISRAHNQEDLPQGTPAPAFSVQTLNGDSLSLAGLHGKVVVLNFWATWCPACREELPDLSRFAAAHPHDCIKLIGISDEDPVQLYAWLGAHPLGYPIVGNAGDLGPLYGVEALPTTVVIDKEGRVAARFVGAVQLKALERAVERLNADPSC
jgi:peroxiredoxin